MIHGGFAGDLQNSDLDEGPRIAFGLKPVMIGRDEHGDPITAPVIVEDEAGRGSHERRGRHMGALRMADLSGSGQAFLGHRTKTGSS